MATEYGDSHREVQKIPWPPPKYDTHWWTFAIEMISEIRDQFEIKSKTWNSNMKMIPFYNCSPRLPSHLDCNSPSSFSFTISHKCSAEHPQPCPPNFTLKLSQGWRFDFHPSVDQAAGGLEIRCCWKSCGSFLQCCSLIMGPWTCRARDLPLGHILSL